MVNIWLMMVNNLFWLVVEPPLWKMMDFVTWDDELSNWMESHKIHVPNHQPARLEIQMPSLVDVDSKSKNYRIPVRKEKKSPDLRKKGLPINSHHPRKGIQLPSSSPHVSLASSTYGSPNQGCPKISCLMLVDHLPHEYSHKMGHVYPKIWHFQDVRWEVDHAPMKNQCFPHCPWFHGPNFASHVAGSWSATPSSCPAVLPPAATKVSAAPLRLPSTWQKPRGCLQCPPGRAGKNRSEKHHNGTTGIFFFSSRMK